MLLKALIVAVLFVMLFLIIGFFFNNEAGLTEIFQEASCPDPLTLQTPVDINKVTGVLYPGQERGGDFKPHGGFRFDNSKNNEIEVKAPIDAAITGASRYIELGELQYLFDFETSCGIRYRFDHLTKLAPKLSEIAEKLPEAREDDSSTTSVDEIKVSTGEVIATAVGYENNVFVDFGVFDSKGLKVFSPPRANGICWFELLSSEDKAKIKSLPSADSKNGTTSAYCK